MRWLVEERRGQLKRGQNHMQPDLLDMRPPNDSTQNVNSYVTIDAASCKEKIHYPSSLTPATEDAHRICACVADDTGFAVDTLPQGKLRNHGKFRRLIQAGGVRWGRRQEPKKKTYFIKVPFPYKFFNNVNLYTKEGKDNKIFHGI